MKTTSIATPGLLAPLQGLWRWLMPVAPPREPLPSQRDSRRNELSRDLRVTSSPYTSRTLLSRPEIRVNRPLRIVRILDNDGSPANVGRMVISGRMADVCAELDRLAACELTLH